MNFIADQTLECPTCNLKLNDWHEGDDPVALHKEKSPNCTLVKDKKTNLQLESELPIHPNKTTLASRLETFDTWPAQDIISGEELAHAGFYYTNDEDKVTCYRCDVRLHKWNHGDVAFHEHTLYNYNCQYVRNMKGGRYIDSVLIGNKKAK